jgi:hypothetical protein
LAPLIWPIWRRTWAKPWAKALAHIGGTIESTLASLPVIGGLLNKLLGN